MVIPAVSEPQTAPQTCLSTEDEAVSHQQADMEVEDASVVASSADSLIQLPVAEQVTEAQSTEAPKPAPAFVPATMKPRFEVKKDLSSMFKSFSAKMKRQSRFSDITSTADTSLVSQSSTFNSIIMETNAISESSNLILTSADMGASGTGVDVVDEDSGSGSLQLSSHVMRNVPSAASHQNVASVFDSRSCNMQEVISSSLSSSFDRGWGLPVYPLVSTQKDSTTTAMTYSVCGVTPHKPGLRVCFFPQMLYTKTEL